MSRIIPTTKITFSIPVHISNINIQFSIYDLVFDAFENNQVNEILAKNKTLKEYWDAELKGINKAVYDHYISLVTRTIYTRLKDEYLTDIDHNIFSISKTKPVDSTGLSFTLTATVAIDMRKIKKAIKEYVQSDKAIKIKSIDKNMNFYNIITLQVENGFMVDFANKYINFNDMLMNHNIDINQVLFESYVCYNPLEEAIEFILKVNLSYYKDDKYASSLADNIKIDYYETKSTVINVDHSYRMVWIYMSPEGTDEYNKAKSAIEKYLGKEFITTWEEYTQSKHKLDELISSKR